MGKMEKLIIINGATRGLGYSLVKELLALKGVTIICFVRDKSDIINLEKFKERVKIIEYDYSKVDGIKNVERLLGKFIENYDKVYFINNICVIDPIGKIGTIQNDKIKESLNVNIISNLLVMNSILKYIKPTMQGYILNISSGISLNPVPGLGIYGLAKNYIDYASKVISLENSNIKSISFYPGGMKTDMQNSLQKSLLNNDSLNDFRYEKIFAQKLLSPDAVASIISINFFKKDSNWESLVSKIYDYYEE
jgi:short-subunit dehydrogenase